MEPEEEKKPYKYRPSTQIISGGYTGEPVGVLPVTPPWSTTEETSGSATYRCYYRDSWKASNCSSTRVIISGRDDWQVSFAEDNTMTVSVTTTITSIVRDDKVETCGAIPARQDDRYDMRIRISRTADSPVLYDSGNIYMGATGTISNGFTLSSYTFTIPPGGSAQVSSLYVHNASAHYIDNPDPQYHDIFAMGTHFMNILPSDYRPGATFAGGAWLSHERSGGAANIYTGSGWQEMRTENGGTGSGNPPLIRHPNGWRNMRLTGQM